MDIIEGFLFIMKQEIWKTVKGFEGIYECSNFGNVRRLCKNFNKILQGGVSKDGYRQINTCKLGVTKSIKIHQMVAIAFLNHEPQKGIVVDHINGDVSNNNVENLRIVTHRFNNTFGFRKDRNKTSSKYAGVHFDKQRNKWAARIQINKKNIRLGFYENEIDAFNAYKNKVYEIL